MSEPPMKRRKMTGGPSPKVTNAEWERHRSQLTHLYIAAKKTVKEIRAEMMEEHGFHPTEAHRYHSVLLGGRIHTANSLLRCVTTTRQSAKAFFATLHNYIRKKGFPSEYNNIRRNSDTGISTRRSLQRSGGCLVVVSKDMGSHWTTSTISMVTLKSCMMACLAFSKVKKAIYRYDTSLLNIDIWYDANITTAEKLGVILRNLITRYTMRHGTPMFQSIAGQDLVLLMLGTSLNGEEPKRISKAPIGKFIVRSRNNRQMMVPDLCERLAFVSCMISFVYAGMSEGSIRICDEDELASKFEALLQACYHRLDGWIPRRKEQLLVEDNSVDLTTDVFLIALAFCILEAPALPPTMIKATELSRFLSLPLGTTEPYKRHLCTLLLLTMAAHNEPSLCAQVIAEGLDPNTVAPVCICKHIDCKADPHKDFTILQLSLLETISEEMITTLLKSGANPNLCGRHGETLHDTPVCCEMSPIFLGLGQTSTVFSALLDAGAYSLKHLDMRRGILKIRHPEVLSVLVRRSLCLERSSLVTCSPYVCSLQAVIADGEGTELTLQLLKHLENPLGCSSATLAPLPAEMSSFLVRTKARLGHSFWTPLTWAVLLDYRETAENLIEMGAGLNKSYLDYMLPADVRRLVDDSNVYSLSDMIKHTSVGPLQAAVILHDHRAVQLLLDAGADPNHLYPSGFSALTTAIRARHQAIVDLLRSRGANMLVEDIRRYLLWSKVQAHLFVEALEDLLHKIEVYCEASGYDCHDPKLTVPKLCSGVLEAIVPLWCQHRNVTGKYRSEFFTDILRIVGAACASLE